MPQSNLQSFVNGFVAALRLPAPGTRLAAIRERTGKGLRLGVANDQPPTAHKPVDITLATLDLFEQVLQNNKQKG